MAGKYDALAEEFIASPAAAPAPAAAPSWEDENRAVARDQIKAIGEFLSPAAPAPAPELAAPNQPVDLSADEPGRSDLADQFANPLATPNAPPSKYDDLVRRDTALEQPRVVAALLAAKEADPKLYERAANLIGGNPDAPGSFGSMPAELIARNIDTFEKQAKLRQVREILTENPQLADWMNRDANAKTVTPDELRHASGAGWLLRSAGAAMMGSWESYQDNNIRWRQMWGDATPEEVALADANSARLAANPDLAKFGADSWLQRGWVGAASSALPIVAQFANGAYRGLQGGAIAAGGAAIPGAIAGGVMAGPIGALGGAIGAGGAAAPAGFTAGNVYGQFEQAFKQQAGQAWNEYRSIRGDDGRPMDPELTKGAALLTGAIEGAINVYGIQKLIPGLAPIAEAGVKNSVKAALANPTSRAALLDLGKSIGSNASIMTLMPVLTEASRILVGEQAKGIDGGSFEPLDAGAAAERLLEAGKAGLETATILAPMFAIPGLRADLRAAKQAEANQKIFAQIVDAARNDELAKRLPNKAQELIAQLKDENGIKELNVPADKLQEVFQTADGAGWMDNLSRVMPDIREKFDEATATGGDVSIPIEVAYAHLLDKYGDALAPHVRMERDGLTPFEAQERAGALNATMAILRSEEATRAAFEGERGAPANEVFKSVRDQLMNAGIAPEHADHYGALYGTFFRVLGDKLGSDAKTMFDRYGFNVERHFPEVASFKKVDALDVNLGAMQRFAKALMADRAGFSLKGAADKRQNLLDWLIKRGGLHDEGGELSARDVKGYRKGRLVAKQDKETGRYLDKTGAVDSGHVLGLDTSALDAWQAGFFPELNDRPTVNEFLAAIDEGLAGSHRFNVSEEEATRPGGKKGSAFNARQGEMLKQMIETSPLTLDELASLPIPELRAKLEAWQAHEAERDGGRHVVEERAHDPAVAREIDDFLNSIGEGRELFQFAGEQAATIDKTAHEQAKIMEQGGATPDEIWQATGFFRGKDGMWRFEISDADAKFKPSIEHVLKIGEPVDAKLGDVLDHPKLFAAYPMLANLKAKLELRNTPEGEFDPANMWVEAFGPDVAKVRSILLHEVQHAIQEGEGFASGGNLSMGEIYEGHLVDHWSSRIKTLEKQLEDLFNEPANGARLDRETELYRQLSEAKLKEAQAARYEYYRRIAGEVEARNVQKRDELQSRVDADWRMWEEEARKEGIEPGSAEWFDLFGEKDVINPPWHTQDVQNPEQVIVARSADGAAARSAGIGDAGFSAYLDKVNPGRKRVADGERPNLSIHDMGGMIPKGSKPIASKTIEGVGLVSFLRDPNGNVYARATIPETGERDVVGYITAGKNSTELHVGNELQGKGIGAELQYLFRKANPDAPTGGLTEAGERTLRKTYDRLQSEGALGKRELYQGGAPDLTSSPAFRKWFGESKVVGADGKPVVVYHGTDNRGAPGGIEAFRPGTFFTTDPGEASAYAFPSDLARREKATGKYVVGKGAEFAGTKVEYYGGLSDILDADRKVGTVYATDDGVYRYLGKGKWEAFDDLIVDHKSFDGDKIKVEAGAHDAQKTVDEYEAMNDRVFPGGDGGRVYPVYLSIKNPIELSAFEANRLGKRLGANDEEITRKIAEWKAQGYDGIKTISDEAAAFMGKEVPQWIPFDASQVKSVHNGGAFDAADPRILYQGADGDVRKGSLKIMDGEHVVSLFEKADLSTFLHETGHFFLEVYRDLAVKGDMTPELRADWEKISAYLGIKGDEAEIPTVAHETFARTFEAYLFEGKAPSADLVTAFSRFKAWLGLIYRKITSLGVQPNDEIRGVMDRMLASDAEIDAQSKSAEYKPLDESLGLMNAPERKAYLELVEAAKQSAREALIRDTLGEVKRETTKAWRDEKNRTYEEVRDEYSQMPVYQAIEFIRTGKFIGADGDRFDGVPHMKLDKQALLDMFGPGILQKLPRAVPPLWSDKAGVHPDLIAEMFGFQSGHAMVEQMMSSPPFRRAIVDEVNTRMRDRHGDLMNDQAALSAKAVDALHEGDRAPVLRAEYEALTKKAGGQLTRTPLAMLRETARDVIARKSVAEGTRVGTFDGQEARAARRVEAALLAGDFKTAAEWKQKQLFAHVLAQEARTAARDVQIARDYLAKFTKAKPVAGIDGGYLDQIGGILDRFDLRKNSANDRAREQRKALQDFLNDEELAGEMLSIPDALKSDAFRQHFRDMSVEDFRALKDTIKNLEHVGRLKNKLIVKGKTIAFETARDEFVAAVKASQGERKVRVNQSMGAREKIADTFSKWDAALLKVEQLVNWIDNGNVNGPFHRLVWEPIKAARGKEMDRLIEYNGKLLDVMGEIPKGRLEERFNIASVHPDFHMTRAEIYAVALNMGTESNLSKMKRGGNQYGEFTDAHIADMVRHLSKDDWTRVQKIWDLVGSLWPEIAAQQKRMTGLEPEKVEARKVTTPHGEFAGGYFPLVYDSTMPGTLDVARRAELKTLFPNGSPNRPTTANGFTKARVENYARPIKLDLQVIPEHLKEVIHDLSFRETLRDAFKLLNDKQVTGSIESRYGRNIAAQLFPWLQAIAADGSPIRVNEAIDKLAQKARTNATIFGIGYRASTIIAQIAGLLPSMNYVSPLYLAKGMREYYGLPGSAEKVRDFVYAKSSEMKHREASMERDLADTIRQVVEGKGVRKSGNQAWISAAMREIVHGDFKGAKADVLKFAFHGIGWMDRNVAIPTWLGAYHEHLAKHPGDEAGAIANGDKAVRMSQGSGNVEDLAAVQRGTEVGKMFTQFYSYWSAFYAQARDLGRDATRIEGAGDIPKLLARAFFIWAAPAVMSDVLTGKGPDTEKDESWTGFALKKILLYPLMAIPGVRDAAGSWDNGRTSVSPSAVGRIMEAVGRLGQQAGKAASGGDVERGKLARTAIDATGLVFGLPIGQVGVIAQNIFDDMDKNGGQIAPRDLLFPKRH